MLAYQFDEPNVTNRPKHKLTLFLLTNHKPLNIAMTDRRILKRPP